CVRGGGIQYSLDYW
nr:immunoglobulin heavy chain junction region [Macaca mulatta]MOV86865.1 immunoglobulin heavy chain junction region [Macaca mulatta]MOV86939.1 immunoglobulin heavy chain junction region [Macaca mulatta]MOV87045.1 immunoglobulin heavy chain junction region [Macaca mulatta]MOV87046.1 immunoglobulin heavy chain junction region [Macaca mulatta]